MPDVTSYNIILNDIAFLDKSGCNITKVIKTCFQDQLDTSLLMPEHNNWMENLDDIPLGIRIDYHD